jgi:hypothetical protein
MLDWKAMRGEYCMDLKVDCERKGWLMYVETFVKYDVV